MTPPPTPRKLCEKKKSRNLAGIIYLQGQFTPYHTRGSNPCNMRDHKLIVSIPIKLIFLFHRRRQRASYGTRVAGQWMGIT